MPLFHTISLLRNRYHLPLKKTGPIFPLGSCFPLRLHPHTPPFHIHPLCYSREQKRGSQGRGWICEKEERSLAPGPSPEWGPFTHRESCLLFPNNGPSFSDHYWVIPPGTPPTHTRHLALYSCHSAFCVPCSRVLCFPSGGWASVRAWVCPWFRVVPWFDLLNILCVCHTFIGPLNGKKHLPTSLFIFRLK